MMMMSALYQTNYAELDFNSASSLKQHVAPLKTHYPDFEPTRLCSFSLMQRNQRRSNKYQFYSHWIDPIRAQTHETAESNVKQNILLFSPQCFLILSLGILYFLFFEKVVPDCFDRFYYFQNFIFIFTLKRQKRQIKPTQLKIAISL